METKKHIKNEAGNSLSEIFMNFAYTFKKLTGN